MPEVALSLTVSVNVSIISYDQDKNWLLKQRLLISPVSVSVAYVEVDSET